MIVDKCLSKIIKLDESRENNEPWNILEIVRANQGGKGQQEVGLREEGKFQEKITLIRVKKENS
jgi:hypothetical protein